MIQAHVIVDIELYVYYGIESNLDSILLASKHEIFCLILFRKCFNTLLKNVIVEPGCTPLSCYSAILTFIVMTLGIFWLLLISPPKNSVPVPAPVSMTDSDARVFDFDDPYDDEMLSSSESPTGKMSLKNTTLLGIILRTTAASPVEPVMEQALDDIVRIVKDSGT
ncbi:hypothetical protein Anas_06120 [Armadillidium nasatum]|uniref:Uncharacterized protein n=1 Tax=Armadillidium nasatum TaxID=96803 RepID=A0A5N5T6L4_9CRUS|nr:hypothetical protein Anas_06120 [Armadillidium nasatum]